MKTPDKKPLDLGPSSWDRYAAKVARRNKQIEQEQMAVVSVCGFVLILVIALVLRFFGLL